MSTKITRWPPILLFWLEIHLQAYWINYAPGREEITLVDRDFQRLTLPLGPTGWDYEKGRLTRGGRYWADPGADLQVEELGTPLRFERLPRGTLAYLRRLLDEAIPHLEIFCAACSHQTRRVGDVWCQHIWWCEKCQHISSPLERSRKMMGQGVHYCPHRFPQLDFDQPQPAISVLGNARPAAQ